MPISSPRSSHSSRLDGRRPLKMHVLIPPLYSIEPEKLRDDCVEFEVAFVGVVPGVTAEVDVTNRTEVLQIIDRAKHEKQIPLHITYENDAIFKLTIDNIEITKRDGPEDLLLRVPIHEVAAICYIKEDGFHILCIKYGTPDNCTLGVLHCENQMLSDGICAIVGQCFQYVYTDVTIRQFDDIVCSCFDVSVSSAESATISNGNVLYPLSFVTNSNPDLASAMYPKSPKRPYRAQSDTSDISQASTPVDIIKEYLAQVKYALSVEELHQLTLLLNGLLDESPNAIGILVEEFCNKVYELFGNNRKHLLNGLCPFIPEKDVDYFANFLKRHGIAVSDNGTLSSMRSFSRLYTRSISDVSTSSNMANGSDRDSGNVITVLDSAMAQLEQQNASVGDVMSNYMSGI